AFPLCVCYALLGFTQMIFNNLGAEGTGIQMLFLSPTPIRTVLLAKNLLHGLLFALVAFLAGVLAAFRMGEPDLMLIATTAAWVAGKCTGKHADPGLCDRMRPRDTGALHLLGQALAGGPVSSGPGGRGAGGVASCTGECGLSCQSQPG